MCTCGVSHRPVDTLVKIMAVVNNNSLSLMLPDASEAQYGLGVYPIASMFNHRYYLSGRWCCCSLSDLGGAYRTLGSCVPNTAFMNDGPRLCYRAIEPIQPGDEITVPYLDLYQPR